MKALELKELLSKYPDNMEVVVNTNLKEVFQLVDGDIMYYVPKTKELYLKGKNAEKDGKICQKVLVLWAIANE